MRKELYVTLSIVLFSMLLLSALGPREAKASPAGPTVYVDYLEYRDPVADGLLTESFIYPAVSAVGDAYPIVVKVANAPHETSEPALTTDKTWAWQFRLSWDPTMWKLASITDVVEAPLGEPRAEQFLKRHIYSYATLTSRWSLKTTYSTSFAATPGASDVFIGDTLTADPTATALPSYYYTLYDTAGKTPPDRGRQWPLPPATSGYYDLPYAENNTQVTVYSYGTITDPSYCLLAEITLTAIAVPPADYKGSAFHLSDVIFLEYDAKTGFFPNTMDAYYVKIPPPIPEFPLGLAPILMLAPAIPIVYLWRTRKKVMKK